MLPGRLLYDRKASYLVLLALGALLAVFVALGTHAAASGTGNWPPPATGDWWITSPTTVSNETVVVNGTTYIYQTTLALDNVTLLVNSTPFATRSLVVYGGSVAYVNNSNVTTYNPSFRFGWANYGRLEVQRSNVERLSTWGILTYSGNFVLRDSSIHDASYGGVSAFFYSSQPALVVENNTLYDIDYFAMFLQYYSYYGAGAGPHNLEGDFVVRNNTVRDNTGGGIYVYRYLYDYLNTASSFRSNLTIENNSFLRNRGVAFYTYNDVWNGQGSAAGNVSFVGRVNITGNLFEGNSAYQTVYLRNGIFASFSGSSRVDLALNFSNNRVVNNSGAGVYIEFIDSADHSSSGDVNNDGSMVIADNTIQRNQGYGLFIYRYAIASLARNASINGTISILRNTITNNADAGIYVYNYAYSFDSYSALIDGPVRVEDNTIVYNSGYGIYTFNYAWKYQGDQNGTAEIRGPLSIRSNEVAYNLGWTAVSITRWAVSNTGSTAYIGGDIDISKNRVYNNSGNGIGVGFSASKSLGKTTGLSAIESNLTVEENWVANNSLFIGISIDRVSTTYYSSASRMTGWTAIRSNLIEGHDSNGLFLQQRTLNYYGSSGAESVQRGDVLLENNTFRKNNQAAAYLYFYSYSYYSTSSRVESNLTVINNTVADNQNTGIYALFYAIADTALSGDTQLHSSVTVSGNQFLRNKGQGLILQRWAASARTAGNDAAILGSLTAQNNTATGNLNEGLYFSDYVSNSQGGAGASARIIGPYTIRNNTLNSNLGFYGGLVLASYIYAYETEVARRDSPLLLAGNEIRGNSGYGAYVSLAGYQYYFRSVAERGLFNETGSVEIRDNRIDSNSRMGLYFNLDLSTDVALVAAEPQVTNNSFSANLGGNALYLRLIDLQRNVTVTANEISFNKVAGVVRIETGGQGAGLLFSDNRMSQNTATSFGVLCAFGAAAYNLTIQRNNITGNDVQGAFFDLANNGKTQITRNEVRGAVNQTAAFSLSAIASGSSLTFENNTVDGNSGKALFALTEGQASVAYNTASNNSRDGLAVLTLGDYLSSTARISIHNNTADGNGANGIWAYDTNGVRIQDNRARANGLAGIRINYLAVAPVISGNNLTGNRFGLYLSGNGTSPITAAYSIENITITASLVAGLYVDDVAVALRNSTVTSSSGVDLSVRQGRIDAFESAVRYASGEIRGSGEIHVWWWLAFRVVWQSGVPVPDASIQMNGSTGQAYGTKTANSTGRVAPFLAEEWAMDDSATLLWSPYTFTATKNSEQGSNTTALDRDKEVWIIIFDIHRPALALDTPREGAIYNRSYVPYTGNVSDLGSGLLRLELSVDGGFPLALGVQPSGAFSGSFTLPDGVHNALFRALDLAGVETVLAVNFTVDTTPPVLIILEPAFKLTNQTLIQVTVQTSDDAVSGSIGLESVVVRANATFGAVVRLLEGPNLFRIRATDRAGNTNETFLTVTLDTLPPSLSVSEPPDNFLTNRPLLAVRGVTEPGARVFVNGQEVEVSAGGAFEGAVPLLDGNNTVEVAAKDGAGNWAYRSVKGALDRVPPALAVTSPPEGLITSLDFVSVEGEVEAGAVVYVNGKGVLAIGIFRESVYLSEGPNNISVVARDAAGNEARVHRTVIKDTTVPFIDILDPAGGHGYTNEPRYVIRGITEPLALVTGGAARTTADASGAFALEVNLTTEETIIRIEAVDLIGNRNQTAVTITLDTSPPPLSIFSPVDGAVFQVSSAEITGATEFGALLTVDGAEVQVAVDGGFRWVVTLKPGANNITIRALDRAGNAAQVHLVLYLGPPTSPGQQPLPPSTTRSGATAGGGGGDAILAVAVALAAGAAAYAVWRARGGKGPEEE